jgi:hypothetical protein
MICHRAFGKNFFARCVEVQNSKSEARNPKWFDKLTTLSHVEGQCSMTKIQMTKSETLSFSFEHWSI